MTTLRTDALVKRIHHKIAHSNLGIHFNRGRGVGDQQLEGYWTRDLTTGAVVGTHIDLKAYGRELGVLDCCAF
jgi:hypothetical protein